MRSVTGIIASIVFVATASCGTSAGAGSNASDAGGKPDAGASSGIDTTVGGADLATGVEDAPTDASAGSKSTAWGPITGACGAIGTSLGASTPSFLVTTWTFDKPGPFDPEPLRPGAKKRYEGPNAGGSSKCGETMSMQLLFECDGATTYKTETEIDYDAPGSITDWIASFGGQKVGVSVTRAYKGPSVTTYTQADAKTLLDKKLAGINEATKNISAADKWTRSILHVWTLHAEWGDVVKAAWEAEDAALKADTILLVTVEVGSTDIVADTCAAK